MGSLRASLTIEGLAETEEAKDEEKKLAVLSLALMLFALQPRRFEASTHPLQTPAATIIEQGKFRLHKYQAFVGEETYELTRDGSALILKANFNLSYLGTKVSLASTLQTQADGTPQHYELKGDTWKHCEPRRSFRRA